MVTRAVHQAEDFSTALRSLGADVLEFPTIRICDPESWDDLDRCIKNIAGYHGIIFTSVNAVEKFFQRVDADTRLVLKEKILCAVGSKTREALRAQRFTVAIIPERFTAEELVAALKSTNVDGKRFLLPRSNKGGNTIHDSLAHYGAVVEECIAYKTEYADPSAADFIRKMLENRNIHMITFFSPSSVEGFFHSMRQAFPENESLTAILRGIHTAVIGTVTAEALQTEGIRPTIIPARSTSEALIDSIVRLYTS
ncbi:MAG: uroporphyrinogen-III synthase [Bacteroidota bacterium]